MSDDFFGQWGGPEGIPSTDPETRNADNDFDSSVDIGGFDPKYEAQVARDGGGSRGSKPKPGRGPVTID